MQYIEKARRFQKIESKQSLLLSKNRKKALIWYGSKNKKI